MSKGGLAFHIPLEKNISRVIPMTEGIIIEFFVTSEANFDGKYFFDVKDLDDWNIKQYSHQQ